jgi:hypothetical protein
MGLEGGGSKKGKLFHLELRSSRPGKPELLLQSFYVYALVHKQSGMVSNIEQQVVCQLPAKDLQPSIVLNGGEQKVSVSFAFFSGYSASFGKVTNVKQQVCTGS